MDIQELRTGWNYSRDRIPTPKFLEEPLQIQFLKFQFWLVLSESKYDILAYILIVFRTQCVAGMLTAEGVLMINRMSTFLRSKYLPARLFSGNEFYYILRVVIFQWLLHEYKKKV